MSKLANAQDSKEALLDQLYKARAALSEYRAAVKAERMPYMELYDANLECDLHIAERALARLGKK